MKPGLGRFADGTFGQVTPTLLPVNVCKKATEHCSLVLWNSIKAPVCKGSHSVLFLKLYLLWEHPLKKEA